MNIIEYSHTEQRRVYLNQWKNKKKDLKRGLKSGIQRKELNIHILILCSGLHL